MASTVPAPFLSFMMVQIQQAGGRGLLEQQHRRALALDFRGREESRATRKVAHATKRNCDEAPVQRSAHRIRTRNGIISTFMLKIQGTVMYNFFRVPSAQRREYRLLREDARLGSPLPACGRQARA